MRSSMIPRPRTPRRSTAARPAIENLEARVVLSTFKVNTVVDSVAVNLKNGKDATGHISLRSAIQAASAKPSADTIILRVGTFAITIAGDQEDKGATGDFDIRSRGAAGQAAFGGAGGAGGNGGAASGGGIFNGTGASLTLINTLVLGNSALGGKGGAAGFGASAPGAPGLPTMALVVSAALAAAAMEAPAALAASPKVGGSSMSAT